MKLGRPVKGTSGKKFSVYVLTKHEDAFKKLSSLTGESVSRLMNEAFDLYLKSK